MQITFGSDVNQGLAYHANALAYHLVQWMGKDLPMLTRKFGIVAVVGLLSLAGIANTATCSAVRQHGGWLRRLEAAVR